METPAATSLTITEDSAVYRVVDAMAANGVPLTALANVLGHSAIPTPEALEPMVKFEEAFRDRTTGELCRRGGPWKLWVRRRLERGMSFSGLVADKKRLAFLLRAFSQHDNDARR